MTKQDTHQGMGEDTITAMERYLDIRLGKGKWCRRAEPFMRNLLKGAHSPQGYVRSKLDTSEARLITAGRRMEQEIDLVRAANEEMRESRAILQDLHNQVRALHDHIAPELLAQAQELRSARMTAVSEIQQSLSALREIRKFFLESDYKVEMERLERLVRLCRELQELKQSGIFDAVCDSAIRLAVGEVKE